MDWFTVSHKVLMTSAVIAMFVVGYRNAWRKAVKVIPRILAFSLGIVAAEYLGLYLAALVVGTHVASGTLLAMLTALLALITVIVSHISGVMGYFVALCRLGKTVLKERFDDLFSAGIHYVVVVLIVSLAFDLKAPLVVDALLAATLLAVYMKFRGEARCPGFGAGSC